MMNWKGFGRRQSCLNWGITGFPFTDRGELSLKTKTLRIAGVWLRFESCISQIWALRACRDTLWCCIVWWIGTNVLEEPAMPWNTGTWLSQKTATFSVTTVRNSNLTGHRQVIQVVLYWRWQRRWDKVRESYPCNRLWRPKGLWDVEAPTFSRQSVHRWRLGCQPHVPADRLLLLRKIPGTHFCQKPSRLQHHSAAGRIW
jgi:hypothetical protein